MDMYEGGERREVGRPARAALAAGNFERLQIFQMFTGASLLSKENENTQPEGTLRYSRLEVGNNALKVTSTKVLATENKNVKGPEEVFQLVSIITF